MRPSDRSRGFVKWKIIQSFFKSNDYSRELSLSGCFSSVELDSKLQSGRSFLVPFPSLSLSFNEKTHYVWHRTGHRAPRHPPVNWTPPRPEAGTRLVSLGLGSPHRSLLLCSLPPLSPAALSPPSFKNTHVRCRARDPTRAPSPVDLYPSSSRSCSRSLNPTFSISFVFFFPPSLLPSSGTVPLLPTLSILSLSIFTLFLSFSSDSWSSSSHSHSNGGRFFSLGDCLFLLALCHVPTA